MTVHNNFYEKITDNDFAAELERIDELDAENRENEIWKLMSLIWHEEKYPAYFFVNYEKDILSYIHSYLGHDRYTIEPMSKKELEKRIDILIRKTGIFSKDFFHEWTDSKKFIDNYIASKMPIEELNDRMIKLYELFEPIYLFSGKKMEFMNEAFIHGLKKIFAGYFFHRSHISRTTFNQYRFFIESSCDTMSIGDSIAILTAEKALKDKKNACAILLKFGENLNAYSLEDINRIQTIFHPKLNAEISIID